MELRVAGTTIFPTHYHPFWSFDRDSWVSAGELAAGELIASRDEPLIVESLEALKGVHRVFNIEVERDHTYFVSESEALVHNTCAEIRLGLGRHLDDSDNPPNTDRFPFDTLNDIKGESPWGKVARAIRDSPKIHFNMKGLDKANFQQWTREGGPASEPYPGGGGWTNRELYEVLTTRDLKDVVFYNGDAPLDWIAK